MFAAFPPVSSAFSNSGLGKLANSVMSRLGTNFQPSRHNLRLRLTRGLGVLTLSGLLAACGGGGGGGDGGGGVPPPSTAPTITSQPANASVMTGQTASFTVSANGTAPLSYSWQRNGVAIAGANAATYTLAAAMLADTGAQFVVVVSNTQGQVSSTAATLTVTETPMAPGLSSQPAAATAVAGQTATFTVTATGTGPLAYQWQLNGTAIAGANAASYTTPVLTVAENGALFSVVVSNSAGSVTSNTASLTVGPALTIGTQPLAQRVIVGQIASFSVAASGTGTLTYQWRKNGTAIAGATAASYTTPVTTLADNAAGFDVLVNNSVGSVTSERVVLTVEAPVPKDYWLRGDAGVAQSGTLLFADGTRPASSFNLTLVDPANPGAPQVAEPGGSWALQAVATEARFNPQNAGDSSERFLVYARGTSLWKLDLLTATAGGATPLPIQVSNASLAGLCANTSAAGISTQRFFGDSQDAGASVVQFRVPGADTQCGTADDGFVAIRVSADATTAPVTVPRLISALRNDQGAITGFLARQGNDIQRLDTAFANPTTLLSVGIGEVELLRVPSGPGLVVLRDGNAVRAFDPASTAAAVTVLNAATDFLQLGEIGGPVPTALYRNDNRIWSYRLDNGQPLTQVLVLSAGQVATRGGSDGQQILLIVANGTTSSRLLSITPQGTVSTVLDEASVIDTGNVGATPTHWVYTTSGGTVLRTVLRAGGTPLTLAQSPQLRALSIGKWDFETVSYEVRGTNNALLGTEVRFVGSDGSNPLAIANAASVGGAQFNGFTDTSVGRIIARLVSSDTATPYSGATLATLDPATGAVRTTYGVLGTARYNSVDATRLAGPGRPVLVSASEVTAQGTAAVDLYLLRVGTPGLQRVTSVVP